MKQQISKKNKMIIVCVSLLSGLLLTLYSITDNAKELKGYALHNWAANSFIEYVVIFLIGFSVVLISLYNLFNKDLTETSFICPSCELTKTDLSTLTVHHCPKCGEEMVKLEGFYDGREM